MGISIGGNLESGRDVFISEGDMNITKQPETEENFKEVFQKLEKLEALYKERGSKEEALDVVETVSILLQKIVSHWL